MLHTLVKPTLNHAALPAAASAAQAYMINIINMITAKHRATLSASSHSSPAVHFDATFHVAGLALLSS